jgi:hypothetical protein
LMVVKVMPWSWYSLAARPPCKGSADIRMR